MAARPSTRGIRTSISTTSGRRARAALTACGPVGGFPDDVDVVGQVQDGAQPEPDQVLVIDEKQPDRHAPTSLVPRVFAA